MGMCILLGFWEAENSGEKGFKSGQDFYHIDCNKCVNSFQRDLIKRLYKIDAYLPGSD